MAKNGVDLAARLAQLRERPEAEDKEEDNEERQTAETASRPGAEQILACALCYEPHPATKLTVVSKSRWNFDRSVVVCPSDLFRLKREMRRRSDGADLVLGLIWGFLAALLVAVILSLTIWFSFKWAERDMWLWLSCYIAFLPGFAVGRAVYYGVGRKSSWQQQFIALFFTLLSVLTVGYVAQVAATNFLQNIVYKNGHPVSFINPLDFLFVQFLGPILGFRLDLPVMTGIVFGLLLGLEVAFVSSAGPRLYTKPYSIKR